MAAGKLNFIIEQGTTFSHSLTWLDESESAVNLTGFTARMQVRPNITEETVLLELTTENGRIVITNPLTGTIELLVTAADTAAITWSSGVYDLEMVSGSVVTRLVEGKIKVSKEVTR